jgi:hypothetical protein
MTPRENPRRPLAADTDPVGLARLHRVIADYLANLRPGTRWLPTDVRGEDDRTDDDDTAA